MFALAFFFCSLLLTMAGCQSGTRRITWQDGGYWVGFDLPSDLVRSRGGWNRKKNSSYILKAEVKNLLHARPDLSILEAVEKLGEDPEPGGKDHLQRVRDIAFALEDWRELLERLWTPALKPQIESLTELELQAKNLVSLFKKKPTLDDKVNSDLLEEIIEGVQGQLPQEERALAAFNLACFERFATFTADTLTLESLEVDGLTCQLLSVAYKGDTNVYALFPLNEESLYFVEFREVQKNRLEEQIRPFLNSVKIGLDKSEVVGNAPLSQLSNLFPKTSHKTKRKLYLACFFLFCTVLPASLSAFKNYPGHGAGAEKRRECGLAVRKAIMRTSGCSIVTIISLVGLAAGADMAAGRSLGLGLILVMFFGLLFTGLFWGLTFAAAYGAGMGAENGARLNKAACVAQAAGGAIAGALAVGLLMLFSGV